MPVEVNDFGTLADSRPVKEFVLSNNKGLKAHIIEYGSVLTQLWAPDKDGKLADIVLGYDTLADYEKDQVFMGPLVGRFANRISKGGFTIDGQFFPLDNNLQDQVHLHGGMEGLGKKLWQGEVVDDNTICMSYTCPDGDQGYPGELTLKAWFTLDEENCLKLIYEGQTDKATHVNITYHPYFNLRGEGNVLDYRLTIHADEYLGIDENLIPDGKILSLVDTPLDFRMSRPVGNFIKSEFPVINYAKGYDHNYIIRRQDAGLVKAARVYEPVSGRIMELYATQPGLQLYTGNHLDIQGKRGQYYGNYTGICLEAQHFPDTPHHEHFPSSLLQPGEMYRHETKYCFSAV